MGTKITQIDTAMRLRRTIESVVAGAIKRERPLPRRGTVLSIDRFERTCEVKFRGSTDADAITARIFAHQPPAPGVVVEVSGRAGALYVSEVISKADWHTVEYETGFQASGRDLQWRYGHDGEYIEFRGVIEKISGVIGNGDVLAELPETAWPDGERIIWAGSDLAARSFSHVYVSSTGVIEWQGSPVDIEDDPTWVSLDGARYPL